jgi:hypothetical protein
MLNIIGGSIDGVTIGPNSTINASISGSLTNSTITNPTVTGGSINGTHIGDITPLDGAFTSLNATSASILGPISASGNISALASIIASNAASASPTVSSSVQLFTTGNVSSVVHANGVNSAGGRLSYARFDNNYTYSIGFADDTYTAFVDALSIQGTQNTGVAGITSTSGSGSWFHTGPFSSSSTLNASGGLKVKEGSNAKQGIATLVAGVVAVANTSVTANSRIFLQRQTDGGTVAASYSITRTAGTSFTITAKDGTGANQTADTSVIAYEIFEPGT